MEKTNFISENQEVEEDIHISCDHSCEADKIVANNFLSRGLKNTPDTQESNNHLYAYSCCSKANHDWLHDIHENPFQNIRIVEVRFKNGYKDFFNINVTNEFYEVGDIVVIEALSGSDIGIISMTGHQVKLHMQNKDVKEVTKKVLHKARISDIEKWVNLVNKENETMMKSRYAAWDLKLNMKVNDVEYQGDGSKAIFYYSADERIDFRELIKILAEKFRIRIEMRQIGVRQEAARLGGMGSCGKELCCSSWMNHFKSVNTTTAKTQQLSLNPQKLAGQCGKLKCCLNFELDTYVEELKNFPSSNTVLYTEKGEALCQKIDIFKSLMWFYYKNDYSHSLYAIPVEQIKEIIEINKKKQKIKGLEEYAQINQAKFHEGDVNIDDLKKIND